ncbi:EAL domain-containing protein [Alkaliphilus hydrothermalis]|uniref:EAL domain-containing protein (Putative c-di-GMP-specific phosphodiesterase class I) n=1 Tax=Alkaliphilus hydrothermalis TaxID=1482730 RepID=A0ABS2NPS9_9FIRM|nr:EAL domain-containing protein [Alkaliphilus hydrothermalis]MBM7614871.1 EAL domain-containing protein (putative c-di-GMP-specific phosphodiesterase class I) [Alkaliphilus hydrothermalis]
MAINNIKEHDLKAEFLDILRNRKVVTYYQPIVSLKDAEIIGYEALSRGPNYSPLHYPNELFGYAKKLNKVWELDLLCRLTAIEKAKEIIGEKYLFINIDSAIVKDPDFKQGFTKEYLAQWGLEPKHIIFEITEHTAIADYKSFKEILENYRGQGYRVAVDDAGEGYAGLRMLAEIRPNFIKIDMGLIRDIDKDMLKRELLKSFQQFSKTTGIKLIGEGIETYDELKTLMEIGIEYGQGYFFQRPQPNMVPLDLKVLNVLHSINDIIRANKEAKEYIRVGDISRLDAPMEYSCHCNEAHQLFSEKYNLQGIVVVKQEEIVGLVMRNKFYLQMLKRTDGAEFLNEPITSAMDPYPLVVDQDSNIQEVSRRAIAREENSVYDYIVVAENNRYKAVTSVAYLLDTLNNIEVE